jgi:hypothetical protein
MHIRGWLLISSFVRRCDVDDNSSCYTRGDLTQNFDSTALIYTLSAAKLVAHSVVYLFGWPCALSLQNHQLQPLLYKVVCLCGISDDDACDDSILWTLLCEEKGLTNALGKLKLNFERDIS